MPGATDDRRLRDLADLVLRLAVGDYAARGAPSMARDEVDALTVGLNLLAETLQKERAARERAEALLRDELHAYEHAPGMFCSLDAESFGLVKCNTTFARAVAIDQDQLIGRVLTELVAEDERELLADTLAGVREGAEPAKTDFTLRAADGQDRPVLLSASCVTEDGHPERLRVVIRDVSRERSLEEQVRLGQKMDAVGRLASGIAHDFNNILAIVVGATELVQMRVKDDVSSESLRMILDAGERAATLTRQLLTFARSDMVNPEVHDLNELVHRTLPMLERPVTGRAALEVRLADEPLFIRIDATQLTQVLLNLTFNALDATPNGGRLAIGTASDTDARAQLVFRDDGAGMSAEVLERACEPFFTTKDTSGGSGLGLAVCYGIVKRAQGELTIESAPGEGTTVTLSFPRTEQAARPAPRSLASTPVALEKRRVLVVDDSDPVRRLVAQTVDTIGHEVLEASNATEALSLLERTNVDLLVTDVVMPAVGGVELARRAWARRSELPVIFMSGYTGEHLGEAVLAKPHVRFLQKPFRATELAELLAAVLETDERLDPDLLDPDPVRT